MRFSGLRANRKGAAGALFSVLPVLMVLASSGAASCSSQHPDGITSPVRLEIIAPKGLLDDADSVKLDVYDGASCNGPDVTGQTDAIRVGETHVLGKTCAGGTQWCATFDVPQDADKKLTWSVVGSAALKPIFRGCVQQAANQNMLTITITIVKIIEGVVCGDGAIGATETCDPGGTSDEACDATTCQTKEVVLSNGAATELYYQGLPTRKQGVSLRWLDDGKLFGTWSDRATGGSGGDGTDEITWRRLTAGVTTETTPAILSKELRLQVTAAFDASGGKKRSGISLTPSIAPVETAKLLVVFARTPPGDTSHVYGSIQATNMGAPAAADVAISGTTGTQSQPAVAATSGGDALVAYVDGSAIKAAFRKSSGTFGAAQTVSTSGVNLAPRVAWLGSDFVVVWTDGDDIKVRRVGPDGTPKGVESVANAGSKAGTQNQPDVAGFASGEYLIVWASSGGAGDVGADVRAQRFDATGNAVGTEVNSALSNVNANGDQGAPVVAAGSLASGGQFYLVAWTDPGRGQIVGRYLSGAGGFLDNNVDGSKSEFDVGLTARALSSPAVVVGGAAPGFCAIAFADDSDGDASADDDRVRVRRFPLPPPP